MKSELFSLGPGLPPLLPYLRDRPDYNDIDDNKLSSVVDDNDNDDNNDNNKLSGRKRGKWLVKHKEHIHNSSTTRRLQLPELPGEIWVEILWKLPIKPLHASKCVSKTWHSYVSQILTTLKGIELPPYGLLFEIVRINESDGVVLTDEVENREFYLAYLSLVGGNKFTKWSVDNGESASATIALNDHHKVKGSGRGLLLGNLTIHFGSLMSVISRTNEHKDWNMHRGLILATLDLYTYLVYNPATKEPFVLSRSVSEASLNRGSSLVAIINLTDCALSTECNFRVVRFVKAVSKTKGMLYVELFSSNNCQWCVSKFRLKKVVIEERWNVSSGVFVNNTLFFLTNKRHVVGVHFHSSGQVTSVYYLPLPRRITRGFCESRLDGSQGCLYLSRHKFPNLWIWKHTGSSTDAWIPQLIFKKSGLSLCQPVAEFFLRQSVTDYSDTLVMFVHPEAPVVYILVDQSFFALHLLNDTVKKIFELDERDVPLFGTFFMYSPCFASFKCLKLANQDHCK